MVGRESQNCMGKRLYVGNLPYDADEAGLRALFAQDGRKVERVSIVLDRETQRPRGFAFVDLATDEEALAAVAALDGSLYGTRAMRVSVAEDRRGPGPGPAGPSGPRGPRPERPLSPPTPGPAPSSAAPERQRHFGPDAKPRRERDREYGKKPKRRHGGDNESDFSGRRGDQDDDDY